MGFRTLGALHHALITQISRGRSERQRRGGRRTLEREFHRGPDAFCGREPHLLRVEPEDDIPPGLYAQYLATIKQRRDLALASWHVHTKPENAHVD